MTSLAQQTRGLRRNPPKSLDYVDVGSGRFVGHRTLAELHALGTATNPAVAVGSVAWDTAGQGYARCFWAAANESVWLHTSMLNGVVSRNDWYAWDETDSDGYIIIAADGGAAVTTTGTLQSATRRGILTLSITSTLNSRAGVRQAAGTGVRGALIPGAQEIYSRTIARHDTLPTAGTDRFQIYIGCTGDVGTTVEPVSGAYFVVDDSSGNFVYRTREASTSTSSGGGDVAVAASVNTWREFVVGLSNTRARFWIDGVLVATRTTNIPTQVYGNAPWLLRTNAEGGNVVLSVDKTEWESSTA